VERTKSEKRVGEREKTSGHGGKMRKQKDKNTD
jgi:hypothetical protein